MKNKIAKWSKSTLPLNIKLKLWEIIRQTNTFRNFQYYLADKPNSLNESEWKIIGSNAPNLNDRSTTISRDTYDNLIAEIRNMPLIELADKPKEIINWERSRRGHKHLEIAIQELLQLHQDHRDKLAEAARRLAGNLESYIDDADSILADYIVGNEEQDEDLYNQLRLDAPTRWLLSHLRLEQQKLKDVQQWGDILVSDIGSYLLKVLTDKAESKEFEGECEICKTYDSIM